MQDYYETLHVHPKADAESIHAAYERLRQRYEASLLDGAADELLELARRRRDEIERAYIVLSDPVRRAAFDSELMAHSAISAGTTTAGSAEAIDPHDDDLIDYRPLPPARRQERSKDFESQPYLPRSQAPRRSGRRTENISRMPTWLPMVLAVAVATFAIVLVVLIATVANAPQQTASGQSTANVGSQTTATAPTPSTDEIVNQFEAQLTAARQVANQVPNNPNAWIELGNALYDSAIIVRERLINGDKDLQNLYIERLPRWLEARDAYTKALAITPTNAAVRADLALSLCYYGEGIHDQSFIDQGLSQVEQAIKDGPEEGRALLSKGQCLVLADPPQTALALEQWQKAIVTPNVDSSVVQQARQLIAEYSR